MKSALLALFLSVLLAVAGTVPCSSAQNRYWEKFPAPPGRSGGVSSIGFDRTNGLWVMSEGGCYFWDSEARQWSDRILGAGQYLTGLYGGGEAGLYATQPGREDHWGEVYRLESGQAEYVGAFYYDEAFRCPGFHVTRDGRFLNWGACGLRIFVGGEWIEWPADLPQTGPVVFETRDYVSLYFKGKLYAVDSKNRIVETKVDWPAG